MKLRKIALLIIGILIVVFLIIGVPILINESYKCNKGYITLWNAEAVLSYYGMILGALIAVITLVLTIIFTKKQIQRETYIQNEKDKWMKTEVVVMDILEKINPIILLKDSMDKGLINIDETIRVFQKYQLYCRSCTDELISYLSNEDYPKMENLINQIQKAMNQYFTLAEEEVKLYTQLRDFNNRSTALKTIEIEKKHPGSFSVKTIDFWGELLSKTNELNDNEILKNIETVNKKLISAYENTHKELLQLKGSTFAVINAEIQQEGDSILSFEKTRPN